MHTPRAIRGFGISAIALFSMTALPVDALTIGVIPGMIADSIEAAAEVARAQGMEVEVIEFLDWTTPNLALASGDLDANYFQHLPYLAHVNASAGYDLRAIDIGVLSRLGLYSNRHASISDIPEGAQVGLASDPTNLSRGLHLLADAGLIKLGRDDDGVTTDDIVENPRKLRFVEVDGPQLVRSMDDLDVVQSYPSLLVNAGLTEKAANPLILSDPSEDRFAMHFVTRADKIDDAEIKQFIEIFQNAPETRDAVHKAFAGHKDHYVLSWQNRAN